MSETDMTRWTRLRATAALIAGLAALPLGAVSREGSLDAQPPASPTVDVTPTTVVALGAAGDELSIEAAPDAHSAVVLINPYGEDCTLRFTLSLGESLLLRTAAQDGTQSLCEFGLVSILDASTARFAYNCAAQAWDTEPKCSPAQEARAPGR